jgi:hypothetical protein
MARRSAGVSNDLELVVITKALIGASVLGLLYPTVTSAEPQAMDARTVCQIAHTRTKHIGESVTFLGEYMTDHLERSLVLIVGCDRGIGLGSMSPEAEKLIDAADPQPWSFDRHIRGVFTATLFQVQPNGMTFMNDDGVRLNVTSVTNLVVTTSPPKQP